jgi:ABC-2 type transport system ATP-binding protein
VTRVRAAEPDRLRQVLSSQGFSVRPEASGALLVDAAAPEAVGALANEKRIALTELVAVRRSLEDAFLALTGGGA